MNDAKLCTATYQHILVNIGGPSRKNVAQAALAATEDGEGGRVKPSRRVEVPAPASGAIGC